MSISDKMAAFAVARVAYISKLKNPTEQQTMFAELWRKRESGAELTAAETRALKTLLAAEKAAEKSAAASRAARRVVHEGHQRTPRLYGERLGGLEKGTRRVFNQNRG